MFGGREANSVQDRPSIPKGFGGFAYAPRTEQEVVALFGLLLPYLEPPICVDEIGTEFPDLIAFRTHGEEPKTIRVEFELQSSNFVQHGHDETGCDLIICWEHDWTSCPFEVISLRAVVERVGAERAMILWPEKTKYPPTTWTKERYLEYVANLGDPALETSQRQLYDFVKELPRVRIQPGKGEKMPTYAIRFYLEGKDTELLGIQGDGAIWIGWVNFPGDLRSRVFNRLSEVPGTRLDASKVWQFIGKLGSDIPEPDGRLRLQQFIKWAVGGF